MSSEGTFFDAGSFRVDRRRALDKLMRYELPDPEMFLLPLARCAVASGAPALRVHDGGGVSLRFGGRPFSPRELEDPYACLFRPPAPDGARGLHLASGLLCALRGSPTLVSVASGKGGERRRLRVWSPEAETLEEVPPHESETVVTVSDLRSAHPEALGYLRERCLLSPVPVFIGEEELPRPDGSGDPDALWFEEEGLRGRLRVPAEPGAPSRLDLCVYGISAERASLALPFVQVEGAVDDDRLALNASQTGVARDARLSRAMDRTSARALELLVRTAADLERRLREAAGLLLKEPAFLHHWKDRLERGAAAETGDLSGFTAPVREGLIRVWSAARACAWVRDAAERMSSGRASFPGPVAAALRQAPVFLSVLGEPLSLGRVEAARRRLGHVAVCAEPAAGAAPAFDVVWCSSDADRAALERLFPGELRDASRLLRLARPAVGEGRPSLEAAGAAALLIRGAVTGRASGEAGLCLPPPRAGSRLHLFSRGKPIRTVTLDVPLRFDAALELPAVPQGTAGWDEWTAAVLAEAVQLYRRVSTELDRGADAPRQDALRAHLLDFLDWSAATAPAAHAWAVDVPLFDVEGERSSLGRLAASLAEGRSFHISDGPRPPEGVLGRRLTLDGRPARALLARLLPGARFEPVPGSPGVSLMFGGSGPSASLRHACAAPPAEDPRTGSGTVPAARTRFRFEEPMLLAAHGSRGGLEALLGLAARFPAPEPVFQKDGAEIPRPKALSPGWTPPCAMVVDLSGWSDPDPGALEPALTDLVAWFYGEVADRWPVVEPGGPLGWDAACYVLESLRSAALPGPLRERLRRLSLFPALGGGRLDLEGLESMVRGEGRLVYAEEPFPGAAEEDRDRPVIREPRRVLSLIAGAEDVPVRKIERPWPATLPAGETPTGSASTSGGDSGPAATLRERVASLLAHLLGRRGIRLTSAAVRDLALVRKGEGPLLDAGPDARIEVNASHPLVSAVLGSGLSEEEQAAYLATVVFTALNRLAPAISDSDDASFQQALAAELASKG